MKHNIASKRNSVIIRYLGSKSRNVCLVPHTFISLFSLWRQVESFQIEIIIFMARQRHSTLYMACDSKYVPYPWSNASKTIKNFFIIPHRWSDSTGNVLRFPLRHNLFSRCFGEKKTNRELISMLAAASDRARPLNSVLIYFKKNMLFNNFTK